MVAVGAVKSGRGLGRRQERRPNTSKARTRQTSQAAAAAPRPRKASKHAAERFRGLGRRQGRRPSLAGYQENFLASAEAVRDAGQVLPGTRKTSLPRQRPSGTPAEHLKSPYPANFAGARSRLGANRFDAGEGCASISNSFQICPYIFAPDFYEQQNEESDEKNDVYGVLSAFRADSLCRRRSADPYEPVATQRTTVPDPVFPRCRGFVCQARR